MQRNPNTKVFPQMLAEWLPCFDVSELPELTRKKILAMSGSTMEKLLRSYKREHGKKHFAATKKQQSFGKNTCVDRFGSEVDHVHWSRSAFTRHVAPKPESRF